MDNLIVPPPVGTGFSREEFVLINYYGSASTSPIYNKFAEDRAIYYEADRTPWCFFDGLYGCPMDGYPGCMGATPTTETSYREAIEGRLGAVSPVRIDFSGSLDTDEGFVIVETEALDPVTEPDLVINIAVIEDNVIYAGPPARTLRYVLRTMPLKEEISIFAPGDTARTARWFTYTPGYKPADMKVVAWVQSEDTNTVFQAKFFDGKPVATWDYLPITAEWRSGTAPVIDGSISPGEWDTASETFVDLSYYVNFPFTIYTMNDDKYLYGCIDAVGDKTSAGIHQCGIFFDSDTDGVLSPADEDALDMLFGSDVEYKTWDGTAWTIYSTEASGIPFSGATRDEAGMIGAYGYGPSPAEPDDHYIYEFKIPLALGNIDALPGDILRPYIYIYGNQEESYWSTHTDWTDPATYGSLTLAASAPVPVLNLFILIFIIAALTPVIIWSGIN